MKTTTDIERGEQALELWVEFLQENDSGDANYIARRGYYCDLEPYCIFCRNWLDEGDHDPNCIYPRAKALVEGK